MNGLNQANVNMGSSWVERKGGFLLSIFLHILLFSFLLTSAPLRHLAGNPQPDKIYIQLAPPVIETPIEVETHTTSPPPPARATYKLEEPEQVIKSSPSSRPAHPSTTSPSPSSSAHQYEGDLAEIRRESGSESEDIGRALNGIRGEIEKRSSQKKGLPASFDSAGAEQGIVRIFDVSGVPEKIIDAVFTRYDIHITQKYIGEGTPQSFLSSAQVRDKTFVNREGGGFFEVFEIPYPVVKKLTALEKDEMQKRGLEPDNTQVIKVVFGIIEKNGQYDLGVTEFQYHELK
jgi:hypothetical protein